MDCQKEARVEVDCVIQRTSYTITTCRLTKRVYREVTTMASRKGSQLRLSRHQACQRGECSA